MRAKISIAAALLLAAGCCLSSAAFAAGKYDGSAPLVCAVLVVHECAEWTICQPRTAVSAGLPPMIKVDVKAMKIRDLEAGKSPESAIRSVDHANNKMVLNGGEAGRGWSVLVNEQTGRMSAVVAADEASFVAFGQCALP